MIPKRIIWHHSATKDSETVSWGAIRRYHTEVMEWTDIGYHFGVEVVNDAAGRRHVEVLLGRPWYKIGAHTRGHNQDSIGVCVVGDYDRDPVPEDVMVRCVRLGVLLSVQFNLPPGAHVGHRDFSSKTCPGNNFDLVALRDRIGIMGRRLGKPMFA